MRRVRNEGREGVKAKKNHSDMPSLEILDFRWYRDSHHPH